MKGGLTYVLARLSPCQQSCLPAYCKVQRGGNNICLYLAFPIKGGKGRGAYICFCTLLALPLSCVLLIAR